VAEATSATAVRRAGKLMRVLAQHLLHGADAGRQAKALERFVHILPSRFQARSK
jgi:hypothetical protein